MSILTSYINLANEDNQNAIDASCILLVTVLQNVVKIILQLKMYFSFYKRWRSVYVWLKEREKN